MANYEKFCNKRAWNTEINVILTSCKQMLVVGEKFHNKEQDGTLFLQIWSYYGQVMASIRSL